MGNKANMESFVVNTNVNGQGTIGLAATPVADNTLMLYVQATARIAEFISRSGTNVTFAIRKLVYDKPSTTATDALELPSGVSAQSSKQNTDANSGFSGAPGGGPACYEAHSHGVSYQYTHSHTITTNFTTTAMPMAASESSLTLVCLYALS